MLGLHQTRQNCGHLQPPSEWHSTDKSLHITFDDNQNAVPVTTIQAIPDVVNANGTFQCCLARP